MAKNNTSIPHKKSTVRKPAAKTAQARSPSKSTVKSIKKSVTKQVLAEPLIPEVPKAAFPVVVSLPATNQSGLGKLRRLVRTARFGRAFAATSLLVLFVTTLFWTVLSARLNQANADQLIDAYLFGNVKTFQGAIFPGTHTFLLKWPAFALMRVFGDTPTVFMLATILMVMLTIGVLVYVLSKIERRPLVFGVLCLALSSMLLLVPAQPYAGALLPVNMAMTTTRNLEYALYIIALYIAVRTKRLESLAFVAVVASVALVVASDKLFAVLAVGGGVLAVVWYLSARGRRPETMAAVRWLLMALVGILIASGLLMVLNAFHVTHIDSSQSTSPFGLIHSVKQLTDGLLYGFGAFLTNFGANPVHGVTIVRHIPRALLSSLGHPSIVAYAVNLLLLGVGIIAAIKLLHGDRALSSDWYESSDPWTRLSVLLLGSTIAAGAVFVVTDHYYPVDARYLTIGLFSVTIAAATYWRSRRPRPLYLAVTGLALLIALPFGISASWQEYQASSNALAVRNHVTSQVADQLEQHKVDRLIGDYWDVTPAKAATVTPLTIEPVSQCSLPRTVLNSSAWFKNAGTTPTAYMAVKDGSSAAGPDDTTQTGSTTTYNGCSLAHIVTTYGVPSERVAINQTPDAQSRPDVLLLLYPNGINPPLPAAPVTVVPPTPVDQGPPELQSLVPFTDNPVCTHGTTLQVIAHEDDDLLFMSPDLLTSIKAGRCIRTVYMTAGDAGQIKTYWSGREQGAMAAYAEMYGVADTWQATQQILAGHTVTVDALKNVPQVALVFLRLPDGNIDGTGFPSTKNQSLQKLVAGTIPTIEAVDGSASYTKQQLVDALQAVMIADLPDQIRTQASTNLSDGDHADHHAVGTLTDLAATGYLQPHTVTHYLGYPDKTLPVNLTDDAITTKQLAFLAYAKFDGAVCQTAFECQNTYTYGSYLTRQYQPQVVASSTPSGTTPAITTQSSAAPKMSTTTP
jgi:LmbE family N-acetylglucosaminyl deacetylase